MPDPGDKLIPLSTLPDHVAKRPNGKKAHASIGYRWRQVGVSNQKLRCLWAGGQWCTTEAWLNDFFQRVSAAKNGEPLPQAADATDGQMTDDEVEADLAEAFGD